MAKSTPNPAKDAAMLNWIQGKVKNFSQASQDYETLRKTGIDRQTARDMVLARDSATSSKKA